MKKTSVRISKWNETNFRTTPPDSIIRKGCGMYVRYVRAFGVHFSNTHIRELGTLNVGRVHRTVRLSDRAMKALDLVAMSAGVTRSDVFRAFLYF